MLFPVRGLLVLLLAVFVFSLSAGCQWQGEPRVRLGNLPSTTAGVPFPEHDNLGTHSYYSGLGMLFEKSGIVYTCRGGSIDLVHVRIAADHTRYLTHKSYRHIINKSEGFTFSLNVEPTMYYISIGYPENFSELPQKQREEAVTGVSITIGQYLTHLALTWHEILTWYDYKSMGVFPEFASAFSWEDIYSNVLGIHIGTWALEYGGDFDGAVTRLLDEELQYLEAVPPSQGRQLTEQMRGKWFDGHLLVNMKKRNVDIGWFDGEVAPSLIPGACGDPEPVMYRVPRLEDTQQYGFDVSIEIEPREWERDKILSIVYPDGHGKRIIPEKHLPYIMAHLVYHGKTVHNYDIDGSEDFLPYVEKLIEAGQLEEEPWRCYR